MDNINEKELINENADKQRENIIEQAEDTNELLMMLKELEPTEKREVRGILIGLQMAKVAGSKSA